MKQHRLSLTLVRDIQQAGLDGTASEQERRNQVLLGRFPPYLLGALGIPDLEIVTSVAIIEKMIFEHGLTPTVIADLHQLVCTPHAVFQSATQGDSIVVLTIQMTRQLPVIAAIKVDKPDSTGKPNIHWLASAYPEDHAEMFSRWEKQGLLLWSR